MEAARRCGCGELLRAAHEPIQPSGAPRSRASRCERRYPASTQRATSPRVSPSRAAHLTHLQYTDVHGYLPDDISVKVDRASRMHLLEVRPPLFDDRLVELPFRIPASLRFRDGVGKWVLKQAYRDQLAARALPRSKMGFGILGDEWLGGPLRTLLRDTLLGAHDPHRDDEAVAREVTPHIDAGRDRSYRSWNPLMLEMWPAQA